MFKVESGVPQFNITSDVPMPEKKRGKRHSIYPFGKMRIGDSFAFPKQMAGKVSGAAFMFAKGTNKKFSMRTVSKAEARIWRIK